MKKFFFGILLLAGNSVNAQNIIQASLGYSKLKDAKTRETVGSGIRPGFTLQPTLYSTDKLRLSVAFGLETGNYNFNGTNNFVDSVPVSCSYELRFMDVIFAVPLSISVAKDFDYQFCPYFSHNVSYKNTLYYQGLNQEVKNENGEVFNSKINLRQYFYYSRRLMRYGVYFDLNRGWKFRENETEMLLTNFGFSVSLNFKVMAIEKGKF